MKIGSLFSGYGGLERGVDSVLGGTVAWVSDIDPGARKVLAYRYPDAPNLGDITVIDWSTVEPIDVLCGGSPCQDLSHAGRRGGMSEGTRSNLWVAMREAIAVLRPSLVIWENVRGAYSADADSEVEPCAGCVGDGSGRHLRALGRVLGDLAELRYDARWHGLRATEVGAPHGRFRVFVAAFPADLGHEWAGSAQGRWPGSADGGSGAVAMLPTPTTRDHKGRNQRGDDTCLTGALLPTPTTRDHKGRNQRDDDTCLTGALLPTPRATDGTKGGPNQRGSSGDLMLPSAVQLLPTPAAHEPGGTAERCHERLREHDGRDATFLPLSMAVQLLPTPTTRDEAASGGSSPSDVTLTDAVVRTEMGTRDNPRLLPTPKATNNENRGSHAFDPRGTKNFHALVHGHEQWGKYADAIARWEHLTREAPAPTEPGRNGNPRLSPRFAEWLMGLPAGWITDVPGITRNEALRLAGNGVVPQQCAAALTYLLNMEIAA